MEISFFSSRLRGVNKKRPMTVDGHRALISESACHGRRAVPN
jgi:hypothetical protein